MCVDGCLMGVWTCGVATAAWKKRERGKRKKEKIEYSHQDALGTPTHPVSGPHNRKSCFHNAATAASARSAVPGRSVALCCTLKPQRGLHTKAGVTHITGVLQDSERIFFFFSYTTQPTQ